MGDSLSYEFLEQGEEIEREEEWFILSMSDLRLLTFMNKFLNLGIYFKKIITTFFMLLIILYLHVLMGMHLMAGAIKKTRFSPPSLKVSLLMEMPLKEKPLVSPLTTRPVREKSPELPLVKAVKKPVLSDKKSQIHLKQTSMLKKPPHLNKKELSSEPIKRMKKTIARKTKNNTVSPKLHSSPDHPVVRPSEKSLDSKNSQFSQVTRHPDGNASPVNRAVRLSSPSLPNSHRNQSSMPISTKSIQSLSSSPLSSPSIVHSNDNRPSKPLPLKPIHLSPVIPPSFNAAYLYNPPPVYPFLAKRRGQEGRVLLKVKVNQHGQVDTIQIGQSSGYPILDESALKTVKQWRFKPATRAGQTIDAWVNVPIVFQVE